MEKPICCVRCSFTQETLPFVKTEGQHPARNRRWRTAAFWGSLFTNNITRDYYRLFAYPYGSAGRIMKRSGQHRPTITLNISNRKSSCWNFESCIATLLCLKCISIHDNLLPLSSQKVYRNRFGLPAGTGWKHRISKRPRVTGVKMDVFPCGSNG